MQSSYLPDFKFKEPQGISYDFQKNLNAFVLKTFPKIEPKHGKYDSGLFQAKRRLIIERFSKKIVEAAFSEPISADLLSKDFQESLISAPLGLMSVLDRNFLVVIEEVAQVIKFENHEVYQISGVGFHALEEGPYKKEILNYLNNLKKFFGFGLYFSFTYDLTQSKMRGLSGAGPCDMFLWNKHLFKDFLSQNIDSRWMLPLIQGYVGTFKCILSGKELVFYLISRRSFYRSGTRYNARGIDDDGFVANFVETEQLIYYNNYCCSHVQIRGSAPIFWQQRGMTAQTKITRSPELTTMAYTKHMNYLKTAYSKSLLVNLLTQSKAHEQLITEAYENQVKITSLPYIRYEYFDFHDVVKGKNYDKINPFIKKLAMINQDFKFFAKDLRTNNVLVLQNGVLRTNCLDCLDRTNFLMTKIGASLIELQLKNMNTDTASIFASDILTQLDCNNPKQQHEFIQNFKRVWADNGDALSKHYSGTGSPISNVTRTGRGTFLGMLEHGVKSLNRFYVGNFEDNVRQECIDLITGRHTETLSGFENGPQDPKIRENEFTAYSEVSILVSTWNVGGFEPSNTVDLTQDLLEVGDSPPPDLMVVGLQEIVDLKSIKNVMVGNNDKLILLWQNFLLSQLKKKFKENYIFIFSKNLVGVLLMVFAHERLKTRITKFEYDSVKCGVMNKLGNKGAIVIRFRLDDTSLCFVNCHLEAGHKKAAERVANINDIHCKAFQKEGVGKKKEEKIENVDYKFLFGDMNFRINLPNTEVRSVLEAHQFAMSKNDYITGFELLKPLLEKDQLGLSRAGCEYLDKYQEGSIMFAPTYKYDVNTDIYDTSKKQRVPAWCDRIMLWTNETHIVKQRFYRRCEYSYSDHRPVCALYVLTVKKVDHNKRKEALKRLSENEEIKEEDLLNLEEDSEENPGSPSLNSLETGQFTAEPQWNCPQEELNEIDRMFSRFN